MIKILIYVLFRNVISILVWSTVPPNEIGRLRVYNHQYGCNTVANIMKTDFVDDFAVGIVDIDKVQPLYFLNLKPLGR